VAYPAPVVGLVIRYAYLWRQDFLDGHDEGAKDRPCAIILALKRAEDEQHVTVLPVTHTPPTNRDDALEIPAETKRRLGLDAQPSWIVLTEANDFIWPGPDLRPKTISGDATDIAYGPLPRTLFEQMRDRFVAKLEARRAKLVARKT
jgi:hypothetical protein